jgi:hypothetical protein
MRPMFQISLLCTVAVRLRCGYDPIQKDQLLVISVGGVVVLLI